MGELRKRVVAVLLVKYELRQEVLEERVSRHQFVLPRE